MNIDLTSNSTTRKYVFTVDNADPRPVPYSRKNEQQYVPQKLEVTYHASSYDNPERSSSGTNVTLSGSRLRKDGSIGELPATEKFYRETWPDWIREIVDEYIEHDPFL